MKVLVFKPQLTRDEAVDLAQRYEFAADASAIEAGRMIRGGDFSPSHLRTIFKWKTGDRGKSRIAGNADEEIVDALRLAVNAQTPRAAIAVLRGLAGVDTPVASAIMTVIDPERYTIIDFRALEALDNSTPDRSLPFYLKYLAYCTALATEWKMPLRQLDRALWQWSSDRSGRRKRRS